jgi:hypothetical protein
VKDIGNDPTPVVLTTAVHDDEKLKALASEKIAEIAMFVEAMKEAEKAS